MHIGNERVLSNIRTRDRLCEATNTLPELSLVNLGKLINSANLIDYSIWSEISIIAQMLTVHAVGKL